MSAFYSLGNIKDRWSNLYRKVIIFLSRKSTKEVMTFLVFVCVSALFWVLQSVYQETDGSFKVQLIIKGMPGNAVFTTAIPTEIKVNVHDKSFQLFRYYYSDQFDTLEVDFHRYTDEGGNFRISSVDLLAILQNRLQSSTLISSISPALIDAKYAFTTGKKIAIHFDGYYSSQLQFRCGQPVLSPDSVMVYAPENILDTLSYLNTERKEYTELNSNVDETLPIVTPLGVKTTPTDVHLHIPVDEYLEKKFTRLNVYTADVPDSMKIRIFPNAVSLRCLINLKEYKKVSDDDFHLSVSYNDIHSLSQKRLPIIIERQPLSANHIILSPDSVEFIIEESLPEYSDSNDM